MASCLYCVPYHSSVLSVCPSNDFDTTATLEKKEKEWARSGDMDTKSWPSGLIRSSSFGTTPLDEMWELAISAAFGSGCGAPSQRLLLTDELRLENLYIHMGGGALMMQANLM